MEAYKSGQGSLTRLAAAVFLLLALGMGCVELYSWIRNPRADAPLVPGAELFADMPLFGGPLSWKFLLCAAVFVAGTVVLRRYMARPGTVDTLIETEQEMKKVSWPTRDESMNATWVVILVSLVLTFTLVLFDAALTHVLGFFF